MIVLICLLPLRISLCKEQPFCTWKVRLLCLFSFTPFLIKCLIRSQSPFQCRTWHENVKILKNVKHKSTSGLSVFAKKEKVKNRAEQYMKVWCAQKILTKNSSVCDPFLNAKHHIFCYHMTCFLFFIFLMSSFYTMAIPKG